MKTKLLPPILSCLVLASFLCRGNAQTADDFNDGLTATSPSPDVVKISWWGSKLWIYQVDITDDLNSMQWTRLPELFMGINAPIELNFEITGGDGDRMFYRVIKHPGLFAENCNMLIHDIRFIGDEEMRTVFSGGLDHLPNASEGFFDAGMLFSTGIAAKWNAGKEADPGEESENDPDDSLQLPGDLDLGHWMLSGGFGWLDDSFNGRDQFVTIDAAGVEIDFEVDPSVDTGRILLSYLFASDEYYMPSFAPNDAMAVFIAELDSSGDPIRETQVNLGLLAESQTYSRAINVYNAGDLQRRPSTLPTSLGNNLLPRPVNIEESGFVNNSPHSAHYQNLPDPLPPYSFGLSGFTSRLEATGGVATAVEDIDVKTRVRQVNDFGIGDNDANRGWGGILFRGSNRLVVEEGELKDLLSGYVAAFGLKTGDPVFALYKVEDLDVNVDSGFIFPNEAVGGPVEVLASEPIVDFDSSAWYWIRVQAEGDNILAKIGKEGQDEEDWLTIDYTDTNDPIGTGFIGLIHADTFDFDIDQFSDMRWDVFEVLGPGGVQVDFSGYEPGKYTLPGWSTVGYGRNAPEWGVVVDDAEVSGSIGGRHVRHSDDRGPLSVLKYDGPGTVEGGKSYRLKIVVADADDTDWASTVLLESNSIQVVPE